MRRVAVVAALTTVAAAAASARAEDAASPCARRGFAQQTLTWAPASPAAPVPPVRYPELRSQTELNAEADCRGDASRLYGDASLILDADARHVDGTPDGDKTPVAVPYHDRVRVQGIVNELFVSHETAGGVGLMLGKKRVVWGPGFSLNPTDLLNPAKDPSEPTTQRTGTPLAMIEAAFATDTLTLLVSRPDWDEKPIAAARWYRLAAGADLNLIAYYTNPGWRFGLTGARHFGDVGLHAEALLTQGSDRLYPDQACAASETSFQRCAFRGVAPLAPSRADSKRIYLRGLIGGRYGFEDRSQLVVELLHQQDGYTAEEFSRIVRIAAYAAELAATREASPATSGVGLDPTMKNYLLAHYTGLPLADSLPDWKAGVSLVANLQHRSGFLGPQLDWSPTDGTDLSLRVLAHAAPGGGHDAAPIPYTHDETTETGLAPFRRHVSLSLRIRL